MYSKFVMPVRADTRREIAKRGVYSYRKDNLGNVKKQKNKNGTSSPFGWGAASDTMIKDPNHLDFVRRNLDIIIAQIPLKKKSAPAPKIAPTLIEQWHRNCTRNQQIGAIGLVPDFWTEGVPPLQDFIDSSVGIVLKSFSTFLRGKF